MRGWQRTFSATALFAAFAMSRGSFAINARTALDRTIPSVKLDSITLKDAIDFVQDVSGANVHVNWSALESAGVHKDAVISLNLRSVPLRKALNLMLSEAAGGSSSLTYSIDENVIEITTQELADKRMFTRVYPVDDLLMEVPDFIGPTFDLSSNQSSSSITPGSGGGGGGGSSGSLFGGGGGSTSNDKTLSRADRAQQLIDLITAIVRPDIWQSNGGTASIRFFNNSLIITAPRSVHDAIDGPAE